VTGLYTYSQSGTTYSWRRYLVPDGDLEVQGDKTLAAGYTAYGTPAVHDTKIYQGLLKIEEDLSHTLAVTVIDTDDNSTVWTSAGQNDAEGGYPQQVALSASYVYMLVSQVLGGDKIYCWNRTTGAYLGNARLPIALTPEEVEVYPHGSALASNDSGSLFCIAWYYETFGSGLESVRMYPFAEGATPVGGTYYDLGGPGQTSFEQFGDWCETNLIHAVFAAGPTYPLKLYTQPHLFTRDLGAGSAYGKGMDLVYAYTAPLAEGEPGPWVPVTVIRLSDGVSLGEDDHAVAYEGIFAIDHYVAPVMESLLISVQGGGMTAPLPELHWYVQGTEVPVQATPEDGYEFASWLLDGVTVSTDNPITVLMDTDHTLVARFTEIPIPPTPPAADLAEHAASGSSSIVGWVREASWATTPVAGTHPDKTISGILFFPVKEENIQGPIDISPQEDDMAATREMQRVAQNIGKVIGTLRFNPGPETLGDLFTMLFGTPETSGLHPSSGSTEAVYEHVWYPGVETDRQKWPVPFSIESQYGGLRSKLIQGGVLRRLPLTIGNNAAVTAMPEFLAKRIIWLYPDSDNTHGSGTVDQIGNTRPAVMTPSPVVIDEPAWHWKDTRPYVTLTGVDCEETTALLLDLGFPNLDGLFMGGCGTEIASYQVPNLRVGGRMAIQFKERDLWDQILAGDEFALAFSLRGALIQGGHYEQFDFSAPACTFDEAQIANQVGELAYDLGWVARRDPVTGRTCTVTLTNTVSSYA
jgi:hypothetical protein